MEHVSKKNAKEDYYWITDHLLETDEHKDVKCIEFFATKVAEQRDKNLMFLESLSHPSYDLPPQPYEFRSKKSRKVKKSQKSQEKLKKSQKKQVKKSQVKKSQVKKSQEKKFIR